MSSLESGKKRKYLILILIVFLFMGVFSASALMVVLNLDTVKSFFSGDLDGSLSSESSAQVTGRSGSIYGDNLVGSGRSGSSFSGTSDGTLRETALVASVSDYENLERILPQSAFVQDLPSDAVVWLRFYNFNTGERQWENSYVLKKGSVVKGDISESDLIIFVSSKYLSQITADNFCEVVKESNTNGDFGVDTSLSDFALAWKFKSMLEYKDCLGI